MRKFVEEHALNVYSQNGEDGILAECLRRLDIQLGTCIEFGAHNGIFCSNTRRLIDLGWTGLMIEADPELFKELQENSQDCPNLSVVNKAVTAGNINQLVGDCDILSIDVDGQDYPLWKAYTGCAKVVIIEINSNFPPDVLVTGKKFGTSYLFMLRLGLQKDYFLLCHVGNLIFIHKDYKGLFLDIHADPVTAPSEYFDYGWIKKEK